MNKYGSHHVGLNMAPKVGPKKFKKNMVYNMGLSNYLNVAPNVGLNKYSNMTPIVGNSI